MYDWSYIAVACINSICEIYKLFSDAASVDSKSFCCFAILVEKCFNFLMFLMYVQTKRTKKAGIVGKYGKNIAAAQIIVQQPHECVTIVLTCPCYFNVV